MRRGKEKYTDNILFLLNVTEGGEGDILTNEPYNCIQKIIQEQ